MKKIPKINIIEPGRICSPDELKQIIGGGYGCTSGTYIDVSCFDTYQNCNNDGHESCHQQGWAGYQNYCENGEHTLSCGEGWNYENCPAGQDLFSCPGVSEY